MSGKPKTPQASAVTIEAKAFHDLQQAEAKHRSIFENAAEGIFQSTPEGRYLSVNPAMARLYGYDTPEEMMEAVTDIARQVYADPEMRREFARRLKKEGKVEKFEARNLRKDGSLIWTSTNARIVRDAKGKVLYYEGFIQDITERKKAQEALRKSERDLQLTLDATTDGIYEWNFKTNVLFFSPRYYTMLGYDPGELPATYETWKSLIHLDDLAGALHVAEDYLSSKPDRYENEFRMRTKAAGYRWIHARSTVVERDEHGAAVRIIGNHEDITERKQTEEEIKSLAKFPSENPNPVLRIDQEGILLYANQATFLLLADWNLQIGQAVPEVLRELMRETFVDQHVQTADIPCGERVFLVAAAPITETGYSNLYIQDVTERKRAEEALREAEAWFRTTLYSIGDAVITTDAKSRVQQMNPVAEALTGWREAEARGKPLAEVFYIVNEETRRAVENPVTRVLREGVVIGLGNHTLLIARDGTERPIADAGAPIRNDRGEAVGVVLVFRDQTAERAAQKALRESEERFSTVFRSSPIGISITRLADGKVSDANPTFLRMFGYTHEEVIGRTTLELNVWAHPEDRDRMFKLLREQGGVKDFETQFRKKSGEIGDLLVSAEVIDLAGEQFLLSLMQNITERKRAETELYIALEKYRVLFESFPLGISVTDAAGNLIEVNRESERLLGIPRDEHTRRMYDGPEWRIVRPDGLPMPPDEYASVRALREKRLVENVEMGIVKGGGEITWISVTAAPIPLEGYGVAIAYGDITERKRAEEAVQVRSQIIDAAIDSVFIHDLDGNILYVNESAAKTRGYTRDEMIGMNLSQLDTPEFAPLSQPRIKDLLKTGQARFDSVHRCKDGSLMLIDIRVQLIEYYGNTAVLGIVRDITERKQAEEALRESEEKYRNVVERANDGITIIQDTIVKYLNPSLAELWGGTVEEVIGTPFANYIHPDELPVVLDRYQRRMAGEDVIPTYETVLKRKDGSKAYVELNAGTIMFQREPADLAIVRDITERKRAEDALRESRARQARAALAQPGGGPGRRAPPYCT